MCFSSPTGMTLKKVNAAIIGPNHLFPFDFLGTQSSRACTPPSRDKITPCPMKSHLVHHPSLRAPRGLPEISQGIFHAFSPTFPTYCRLIQRGHATNFSQRDCVLFSKTDNVYSTWVKGGDPTGFQKIPTSGATWHPLIMLLLNDIFLGDNFISSRVPCGMIYVPMKNTF